MLYKTDRLHPSKKKRDYGIMDKVLNILDGDDVMTMTVGMQVPLEHGYQRKTFGTQFSSSLDLTQIIKFVGKVPSPLSHPSCLGQSLKASGLLRKTRREKESAVMSQVLDFTISPRC